MPAKGAMKSTAQAPVAEPRLSTGLGGVALEAVSRTYAGRRGPVPALADLTLQVAPQEIVAVVGPSGCGKSTLLELVCGLQSPDAGQMRCEPAAYMPQRDLLLPWASALDNAALALRLKGLDRAEARE
ncbi:MAG: ATP-binding cassette domain-containing protein, partial [Actinomycetota bacterium]|nr:ATP-binding cassette domain-containing protein [Actinomycetota bacterium]